MFKTARKYERRGLKLRAGCASASLCCWPAYFDCDVDSFWCRSQHPGRTEPLTRCSVLPAQPAQTVNWFPEGEAAYWHVCNCCKHLPFVMYTVADATMWPATSSSLLSTPISYRISLYGDRLLSLLYCGTNYCLSWCLLCGAGELCSLEDKQSPPFALILSRHDAWSFGDIFAHYEIPFFGLSRCTDGLWVANFPAARRES